MAGETRFGVEEEFVLLDAEALVPVSARAVHDRVLGDAPGGGCLRSEFTTGQTEAATAPVATLAEAGEQLRGIRGMLREHAPAGAVVASIGAPFALAGIAQISASAHYDDVAGLLGHLTAQHVVNGLHVHVEVLDDEERVRALCRVREWLPVLLALSVNSPFAQGAPAGLASWRSPLIRRLPVSGAPPAYEDAQAYHRAVDAFVAAGALPSRASTSWAVRLSEHYDTVEVRVADAQLEVDDTLLLTALIRALVVMDERVVAPVSGEILDASMWLAGRHGMEGRLLCSDGVPRDAWSEVERMLQVIRPVLDDLGDTDFVSEQLIRIREEGTGAQRQLRAHAAGGRAALADLYREW